MTFNTNSRTKNAAVNSVAGTLNQVFNLLCSFGYRTVFLMFLNAEYLGLNGLFSNILNILSIAELGIGTAIIFRLYKPIANNDARQIAALMDYYKKVYRVIALIITIVGSAIAPLLPYLIKDLSAVPADVNLYVIYFLFLFQSVSSYLFVYKTSILSADQRTAVTNFFNILSTIVNYGCRILVLCLTKNFTLVLIIGISATLLMNIVTSLYVHFKYKEIFMIKAKLDKKTSKEIFASTKVLMAHKIGGSVVAGTDNIILSYALGLTIVGIYSNYSMIINSISVVLLAITQAIIPSIGNLKNCNDKEKEFRVYKTVLYLIGAVCFVATVGIGTLINPFIEVWIGSDYLMNSSTVYVLTAMFFVTIIQNINVSFINAFGLFNKDFWRPFVQAALNVVVSIALVHWIGIVGIFIGTLFSALSTVFWRDAYLLGKYEFQKNNFFFFLFAGALSILSVLTILLLTVIIKALPGGIGWFVLKFFIVAIASFFIYLATSFWTDEFKFAKNKIISILNVRK